MKVISWEFQTRFYEILNEVMNLKRKLWNEDRESYKEILYYLSLFEAHIKDNVERHIIGFLKIPVVRAKNYIFLAIDHVDSMVDVKLENTEAVKVLEQAKTKLESLLVFLELDEAEEYGL